MAVLTTIATSTAELSSLTTAWSELADAAGHPYARAEWMLSWWKHAAPPAVDLAVVASFAGPELIGIAPFFATRERPTVYRLLASPVCAGVEPLARPGAEEEVAASTCAAMAALPHPPGMLVLKRLAEDSAWPRLLAEAWPGKPPHLTRRGGHERAGAEPRGPHERGMAAVAALLEAPGADPARAAGARGRRGEDRPGRPERMPEEIETFIALHLRRMEGTAESEVVGPGVAEWLSEAGVAMADEGALRLWTIRVDGKTISAQLFVAAGGQFAFWLGAFDDDWARSSPGLVALWPRSRMRSTGATGG